MVKFKLVFYLIWVLIPSLTAQNKSASALFEDLKKLKVVGSVLYVAAHPDDENTRLISYLSKDLKLHTSYVSLTRGDGGQNLIGPELDELLGVIRTNELLEARKIDGGYQFFTRANDFGYSKTAEETFSIWNKDTLLLDLVRLIRILNPDVIINRFDHRTSGKTHGHHTASAILSKEAFDQARNSLYQREALADLEPVRPSRLYFNTSWFFWGTREKFEAADKSGLYALDIGSYYPALGTSNGEISARSRSMHKSQGFGINSVRGTQMEYFERLDAPKDAHHVGPFDGMNFSWSRFNGGGNVDKILDEAIQSFELEHPEKIIPLLQKAELEIESVQSGKWKEIKLREIRNLIFDCAGIYAETSVEVPQVSIGDSVKVHSEFISRISENVRLIGIRFIPSGTDTLLQKTLQKNVPVYVTNGVLVPQMSWTAPFWLINGRKKDFYCIDQKSLLNEPLTPKNFKCSFTFEISGRFYQIERTIIYKNDDPVAGEIKQPLEIIPALTLIKTDPLVVVTDQKQRQFELELIANQNNLQGELEIEQTPGVHISPSRFEINGLKQGQKLKLLILIQTSDLSSRIVDLKIKFKGNPVYTAQNIRYPHIDWQMVLLPGQIRLSISDCKVKTRRIAYLEGAGDYTDEALKKMGHHLNTVATDHLDQLTKKNYDVLVFGIRALNTQESLKNCKAHLERFAAEGGKVIFQYNTTSELKVDDFYGTEFKISRGRVTDELSPVRILKPEHAFFNVPNKIKLSDFEHWVQERGLYFPGTYPPEFEELLSFHDPGETELKSGVLVKKLGKGYLIYTPLAWFRQLPSGVPGAYRLLSNLVSFE